MSMESFGPRCRLNCPTGATVLMQTSAESINVRELAPPDTEENQIRIYECLARSYETGDAEAAARHDERQP